MKRVQAFTICQLFFPFFTTSGFRLFNFLVSLRPFLGFLAFRRSLFDFFRLTHACGITFGEKVKKRPSSGQKSQKRAQADKKIKKSSTFNCKKGQKQLTHHKKSLHSFHTSEFSYLRMEFHETFHNIAMSGRGQRYCMDKYQFHTVRRGP